MSKENLKGMSRRSFIGMGAMAAAAAPKLKNARREIPFPCVFSLSPIVPPYWLGQRMPPGSDGDISWRL